MASTEAVWLRNPKTGQLFKLLPQYEDTIKRCLADGYTQEPDPTIVPDAEPFAAGGVIDEPAVGVGLTTGATYHFDEPGPELVVPTNDDKPPAAPSAARKAVSEHAKRRA